MSFWSAALTVWRLADELTDAKKAAQDVLAKGGSPLKALDAFAQKTHGQLDDEALRLLKEGLIHALQGIQVGLESIGWLATHETTIRASLASLPQNIDTLLGIAMTLGWHAQGIRAILHKWLEEDEDEKA